MSDDYEYLKPMITVKSDDPVIISSIKDTINDPDGWKIIALLTKPIIFEGR